MFQFAAVAFLLLAAEVMAIATIIEYSNTGLSIQLCSIVHVFVLVRDFGKAN